MVYGRCAACRFLRRRCPSDCTFAPYFPPNNPQRFASVHRIYGASNVARMLQQLPADLRAQAADTLYYEAEYRVGDPVYGCVGVISRLIEQINEVESELAKTRADIVLHSDIGQQAQAMQILDEVEDNLSLLQEQSNVGQTGFSFSFQSSLK
ncbi:LOB domain-containing protein 24-like [Argentina anserina]|uniref:LOB domain-containing protein 24-like n=1 Tax=Argentina anserina TaxID=57926 RepID=UPI0021764A05|nr:LOB domain-containing protein 24-like [Potentilla anserina]